MARDKKPTREDLRLVVAAGNNKEMKAKVDKIMSLKKTSKSYRFDIIYRAIWSAVFGTRLVLLATGVWPIPDPNVSSFYYATLGTMIAADAFLIKRTADRKAENDLDIQDETNEVLEFAEQYVSDEVENNEAKL